MAIKVNEVVCVTDTDKNEEWLGYCVGYEKKNGCFTGRILVKRYYGMGSWTFTVEPSICS